MHNLKISAEINSIYLLFTTVQKEKNSDNICIFVKHIRIKLIFNDYCKSCWWTWESNVSICIC